MKYERDVSKARRQVTRTAKLFELHRQETLQTGRGRAYPDTQSQRPDIALQLRERAIRSLRPYASGPPR